jgi:hypothetical protein
MTACRISIIMTAQYICQVPCEMRGRYITSVLVLDGMRIPEQCKQVYHAFVSIHQVDDEDMWNQIVSQTCMPYVALVLCGVESPSSGSSVAYYRIARLPIAPFMTTCSGKKRMSMCQWTAALLGTTDLSPPAPDVDTEAPARALKEPRVCVVFA